MVREIADLAEENDDDPCNADLLMISLMTFAKMYNMTTDWPKRDANARVFVDELRERMQKVPWSDLIKMMVDAPAN